MKRTNFENYPVTLNVEEVGEILRISRATAYNLVKSDGFPALKVGSRIIVPKQALINWIDNSCKEVK